MRIVKKLVLFLSLVALLAGCAEPVTKECGTTDVMTLAGGTLGSANGTGMAAQFYSPQDVTTDGTNLYVSDTRNNKIRKVVIATGEVTTFATLSNNPYGITTDGTHLYVADSDSIYKIAIATAEVTLLVSAGLVSDPYGMTTDGTYLYVAESGNHRISKVVIADGTVTTLAGSTRGFADGTGSAAQFAFPSDVVIDGTNLYVTDQFNHRVRKVVIATGEVTTLAGTGEDGVDDGEGTAAKFSHPMGLVRDGDALYVSDYINNRVRKVVISTGKVTTLIGTKDDGNLFHGPFGLTSVGSASDADGISLYVTEWYNDRVSKIHHIPGECANETATQVSVTGNVLGLTAKLVLQNNGANDLTITENDSFTFEVASGTSYYVTVKEQPNGHVCTVSNGEGKADAVVSDVAVSCEASATPPSDATAPTAPTIDDLTTVDRQPTLTGTYDSTDAEGGFKVKVNGQSFTLGTDAALTNSGNNWTLTMPQVMAVGIYDIAATAMDAAGNTSTASGTLVVVEAPPVPTVTAVSTEDPTPTFSGTFDSANAASFTVAVNGVTYTKGTAARLFTSGNSWNLTIPDANALAVGTYEVVATATDAADAVKTDATTNELVVRDGTATWSLEDVYTNDTTPTISGTFPMDASGFTLAIGVPLSYGSKWEFYAGTMTDPDQGDVLWDQVSRRIVGTFDRATGVWQLTASWDYGAEPLEERTYLLRMSDVSPDQSLLFASRPVAAANLVVDLTAPTAPTVTSQTTADTTPTLTGTFDAADADVLTVAVNSVNYTLGTDDALTSDGDTWSLTIPAALSDGTYDVVATVKDKATNSATDITTDELVVVPSVPSAPGGVTATPGDSQITLSWSTVTGATSYNVYHGTSSGVTTATGTKLTNVTSGDAITGLTNGTPYYFVVTAVNVAGESTASSEVGATPLDMQAPTVSASPGISNFTASVDVTLSCADTGGSGCAAIHYTQDGSTPTTSSATYSVPISITSTATLKFFAVDGAGNTSAVQSGTYTQVAPAAPAGVTPTAGDAEVSLSWSAVTGATSYNVYHGTSSGVTTATGTKVANVTSGNAITGLTNDVTYYFIVTAVNAAGESAASGEVSAKPLPPLPAAPATVTPTAGDGQVSLNWSAVTGTTSYNVYYGTSSGVTTATGTKVANVTSGDAITGLTNGTTYYFIVTAVNAAGEGTASGEVSATTLPAAPAGVTAMAGDGQVSVSWSAVTGATSYNVYLGTSSGVTTATGTKVANVTSGDAITGLTNGTTYYFIVTAENAAGEGTASSEVNALPQAPDTTAPAVASGGLTPADGATGVARDASITAAFDEDIFATTVDSNSFTLADSSAVSGTVSFDGGTNTATFTPDSKMAMLTDHTATLTTGITDLAGNPLASNQTWSFTTADGVWGVTPTTVDISADDNNGGRVVVDEQGNATAVWLQFNGTNNSVVANRYVPGTGWGASPEALESATGDAAGVELAVDGNGNVFAVWQQSDGAVWDIWANRYDAGASAWGTAARLDSDTSDAGQPQVAVDGNGNAIVVWNQFDGVRNNIWASRYAGSWSGAELIETDDTTDALFPAIAMDPAGNAIVVWHLGDGFMSGDIMATHYTDGAWNTTAVTLETRAASDIGFGARVAMDSNGNAIAVWGQFDGSVFNIWANRYDAGASTWGTASVIADGTGDGVDPRVAVDGSGNALVVWVQSNGNDVWSNRFTVATTTWGTAEKIDNLAGAAMTPQIAMDTTGHGVAVWFQTDGLGRSSTFANRYVKDTGWGTAAVIENDDTYDNNISSADVGMNTKGEAMAVWHQMQGSGKFDVWANSFE